MIFLQSYKKFSLQRKELWRFFFFTEKDFCKWLKTRELERVVMRVLSDLEGLSLLLGILASGGLSGLCQCKEWGWNAQPGSCTPGESPTGQRILSGLAGYGEVE